MLALVGVFVVGSSAQGAARWFSLGPLQLQPSEFAVLALILAVASYCARRDEEGLAWRDVFRLLIMAGIPIVLVLLQPDLGTAMIMVIVLLVMLAVAGLPDQDPDHAAPRHGARRPGRRRGRVCCTTTRSPA